jgi:hypothetical protein
MCACSAASIFLFASSKLLPRIVSDSSSQTPFQLSSSGQKLQSFGTLADTFSFTAWAVIVATPFGFSLDQYVRSPSTIPILALSEGPR